MSENTKIEWCDHSWSPWRGCTKVSAGCANCYAETLSKRNPAVLGQWGKGKPRVLAKNWRDPVKWDRAAALREAFLEGQGGNKVFPSLCDWLDDEVPVEWLARFLKLIHDTPNLTWLLLTKRPELFCARVLEAAKHFDNVGDRNSWLWLRRWTWTDEPGGRIPPCNVWIGTSVEDQPTADRRIPELLKIPAAGRFLSLEPLLGPVELRGLCANGLPASMDWLIIGGESGHGARPCNIHWIRSLVTQGNAAGVPTFVKQLGACVSGQMVHPANEGYGVLGVRLDHPKGGDPSEWPDDLRVREFPEGLR